MVLIINSPIFLRPGNMVASKNPKATQIISTNIKIWSIVVDVHKRFGQIWSSYSQLNQILYGRQIINKDFAVSYGWLHRTLPFIEIIRVDHASEMSSSYFKNILIIRE